MFVSSLEMRQVVYTSQNIQQFLLFPSPSLRLYFVATSSFISVVGSASRKSCYFCHAQQLVSGLLPQIFRFLDFDVWCCTVDNSPAWTVCF